MLIGGLMVTISMVALSPVLPKIETALASNPDEALLVKMLIPVSGAAMVIGAPLTGFFVDRKGLRAVLTCNSLIFAIAGTAGFYLGDIYSLLISRLFVGLAAAGMATTSMTLINTRLQGNARARWMGFHISTAMFGSLLITPAVGLLGELGWRWPFLTYSVGLIVAIAAWSGLQEPRRRSATDRAKAGGSGNPLRWFPLWFLPLALVMGSVTYLPSVYLPFAAKDVGVTSPAMISFVMLADAILGATMALLFGRSQRYISSTSAFMFSFACTGGGMLAVSMAGSFAGLVAGMLIFGFGIGWFVPNLMTSLSRRVSQEQQGRAVGIVKATHYLASPLAVLAVEPIARDFGTSGVLRAAAIASFTTVIAFAYIRAKSTSSRDGKVSAVANPGMTQR
jgi:MFS family permease